MVRGRHPAGCLPFLFPGYPVGEEKEATEGRIRTELAM